MKNFLLKNQKIVDRISKLFGVIAFIACASMMILITIDVILRKTLNMPILGSYEIVQYILMCLVFASMGYTQHEKGHIKVTMISGKLKYKGRCILNAIYEFAGAFLMVCCSTASFIQGGYLLKRHWVTDVLKFQSYPFYYFEAVCFAFFAFVLIWDGIRHAYGITDQEYADEVLAKEYT